MVEAAAEEVEGDPGWQRSSRVSLILFGPPNGLYIAVTLCISFYLSSKSRY